MIIKESTTYRHIHPYNWRKSFHMKLIKTVEQFLPIVETASVSMSSRGDKYQLKIKVQIISDLKNMKLKHEHVKVSIYAQTRSPRKNHYNAKIPYWTLLQGCLSMSDSSWHWELNTNDSGEMSELDACPRFFMDVLYMI